jgi:ATP-dependent RNA helicase RhlE
MGVRFGIQQSSDFWHRFIISQTGGNKQTTTRILMNFSTPRVKPHSSETSDTPRQAKPVSFSVTPVLSGSFTRLMPQLQRSVAEEGYVTPTPIQEQGIPHLLAGRDLIGCAQTGTGKTAAFALPILQTLTERKRPQLSRNPRVLILAPTRELAAQIGDSIRTYGRHLKIRHAVIFGGVGQSAQVNALRGGLDILVATPGRLLDLMQQGFISLDAIEIFVLDEADRMLDMGFLPDVRKVIARLPQRRQTLFFSATMEAEVVSLARTLVRDAVSISITPESPAVERIGQRVLFVDKGDKDALLSTLLNEQACERVIVFTQMKHMANRVVSKLADRGIKAVAIHGNKSQNARTEALDDFKRGRIKVLVATDIAARGIDVDGISHVINYDLPIEAETYVHRIGRTARAGADGHAISFCSGPERGYLSRIERFIRCAVAVDTRHAYHSESARRADADENVPMPPRGGKQNRRPSYQRTSARR